MVQLSQSEKLLAEQMAFTTYITSQDEHGTPQYFLVKIRGDKMSEFKDSLNKGNTDPEEFGELLSWGYGEPSASQKQDMVEKYGCNFDEPINLINANSH